MDPKWQELNLGDRVAKAFADARVICLDKSLSDTWKGAGVSNRAIAREMANCDLYIAAVKAVPPAHGMIDGMLDVDGFGRKAYSLVGLILGAAGMYYAVTSNSEHAVQSMAGGLILASEGSNARMPPRTFRYGLLAGVLGVYLRTSDHYAECPQFQRMVGLCAVASVSLLCGYVVDVLPNMKHGSISKESAVALEQLVEAKQILQSLMVETQTKRRKRLSGYDLAEKVEEAAAMVPAVVQAVEAKNDYSMSESAVDAVLHSDEQPIVQDSPNRSAREQRLYDKLVGDYGANGSQVDDLIDKHGANLLLGNLNALKQSLPKETYRKVVAGRLDALTQPSAYYDAIKHASHAIRQLSKQDVRQAYYRRIEEHPSLETVRAIEAELGGSSAAIDATAVTKSASK